MNKKPLERFKAEFPDLYGWIKSICRFDKVSEFIEVEYKRQRLSLHIYTRTYRYHIGVRLPNIIDKDNQDGGYLGLTFMTRKPRAGEDWNRGRDLADGAYCLKTWKRIERDIVASELVKVVQKPPFVWGIDKDGNQVKVKN